MLRIGFPRDLGMVVSWAIRVVDGLTGGWQGGSVPGKIQEEKRAEDAGMLSLEAEGRSELWHTGDPHTQTEEGTAVTARLTLGICPGRC